MPHTFPCTRPSNRRLDRFPVALAAMIAGSTFALAARGSEPAPTSAKPMPASAKAIDTAPAVLANQRFSAELLRQIDSETANTFFSPWSLNVALDMARVGARGATAAALAKGQHLSDGGTLIDSQLAQLRADLADDVRKQTTGAHGFKFNQANRLWVGQGMVLTADYPKQLMTQFEADSSSADFMNKSATADAVNAWVKDKTNGKIPTIVGPSAVPDQGVILTNAVYFFGKWSSPFDASHTKPQPFKLSGGQSVEVPMMLKQSKFDYAQLSGKGMDGAQAIRLGYVGPASATLILPAEGKMNELVQSLDIAAVRASLQKSLVLLSMPRVDVKSTFSAAAPLKNMGMGPAFSTDADYTGITPMKPTYIADVMHAATLRINESSTEAAGATFIAAPGSPPPREEPARMELNRPFLIVISHEPSGAVLFMGRINDPRQ